MYYDILIYLAVALFVGFMVIFGGKESQESKEKRIKKLRHDTATKSISDIDLATNSAYSSLSCNIHHNNQP